MSQSTLEMPGTQKLAASKEANNLPPAESSTDINREITPKSSGFYGKFEILGYGRGVIPKDVNEIIKLKSKFEEEAAKKVLKNESQETSEPVDLEIQEALVYLSDPQNFKNYTRYVEFRNKMLPSETPEPAAIEFKFELPIIDSLQIGNLGDNQFTFESYVDSISGDTLRNRVSNGLKQMGVVGDYRLREMIKRISDPNYKNRDHNHLYLIINENPGANKESIRNKIIEANIPDDSVLTCMLVLLERLNLPEVGVNNSNQKTETKPKSPSGLPPGSSKNSKPGTTVTENK